MLGGFDTGVQGRGRNSEFLASTNDIFERWKPYIFSLVHEVSPDGATSMEVSAAQLSLLLCK